MIPGDAESSEPSDPASAETDAPELDPPASAPGRSRPVPSSSGRSFPTCPARRLPILPIAIALVAILAGGALFMSGYSLGAKSASQPGTPVSEDQAFQPFWDAYHSIDERYAGGDVDRAGPGPGRDQGHVRCPRRPVLLLSDLR